MVITKELAAKGTAMLGSAGAGGTGLYYGGGYLFGNFAKQGSMMDSYLDGADANITFDVKVVYGDNNQEKDIGEDNTISFVNKQSPITVKVKPDKLTTTTMDTSITQTANADENLQKWTCSFKFEVEGTDYANKTIKQDY